MNQLRYFSAFLLSTLTFILIYFVFLSLPSAKKILKPAPSKVIKIALITPVKEIVKPLVQAKPTPVIAAIIPPVLIKKVVKKKPKKVVKKKVIKRIIKKKIVKKKIIKKKIVKKKVIKKVRPKKVIKKIIKKKIIPKPVETYVPIAAPIYVVPKPVETYIAPAPPVYVTPQPVLEPVIKASSTPRNNVDNSQHKKAFLRNVRSKIIANKKYPKMAKRRHIEGSVKVRFDITKHGHVSNIRFINGKRIFQKSIRKTLESTFPMGIPANVLAQLPISNVSVVLHFNIR